MRPHSQCTSPRESTISFQWKEKSEFSHCTSKWRNNNHHYGGNDLRELFLISSICERFSSKPMHLQSQINQVSPKKCSHRTKIKNYHEKKNKSHFDVRKILTSNHLKWNNNSFFYELADLFNCVSATQNWFTCFILSLHTRHIYRQYRCIRFFLNSFNMNSIFPYRVLMWSWTFVN